MSTLDLVPFPSPDPRPDKDRLTEAEQFAFLKAIYDGMTLHQACRPLGIPRMRVVFERRENAKFDQAVKDAYAVLGDICAERAQDLIGWFSSDEAKALTKDERDFQFKYRKLLAMIQLRMADRLSPTFQAKRAVEREKKTPTKLDMGLDDPPDRLR